MEIVFFYEKMLVFKLFTVVGCHVVILLCTTEKREREDGDGGNDSRVLVVLESVAAKHQSL